MNRMVFGRVPNVDRVDFTLPPDSVVNERFLKDLRERTPSPCPQVLLGTAAWSDREFLGRLYPRGTRARDFLHCYSRAFPTNELNSSYFGYDAMRFAAWAAMVPEDFLFCPKLPARISHERKFVDAAREMDPFVEALQSFGKHLGRAWTILPPDFGPHRADDLTAFLERYAPHLPLGIELRHQRWFSDSRALSSLFEVFEALEVTPMLTDVAGRRDVLHMRLCTNDTMIRFVGNSGHTSDAKRLDDWTERIGSWIEHGLERVYFFLHQERNHETIELAQHMLPRLGKRTGIALTPLPLPATEEGSMRQSELF